MKCISRVVVFFALPLYSFVFIMYFYRFAANKVAQKCHAKVFCGLSNSVSAVLRTTVAATVEFMLQHICLTRWRSRMMSL